MKTSPRELFCPDFVQQLRQWRKEEVGLVILMDCDESMGGALDKTLAQEGP